MKLTSERREGSVIVTPIGRIDGASAPALEDALAVDADPAVTRLVLDLGGVNYMSSAGLRIVVIVSRRMKQRGGLLVLCELQPLVLEVFDISGLLTLVCVKPTLDAALAA